MKRKKTLNLGEINFVGQTKREFKVLSVQNIVDYKIGQRLSEQEVKEIIDGSYVDTINIKESK